MLLENRSDQPQELLLFPISGSAIKTTIDQVTANPKRIFLDDLNEIRKKQPVIKSIMENCPFDDEDIHTPSYKYGICSAFRFFRNQADEQLLELPIMPDDYLDILIESVKEDNMLKSFKQYHLPTLGKIGIELRSNHTELWEALQDIFTDNLHEKSFLTGILNVVFLFKTYQENDHFERLLEA